MTTPHLRMDFMTSSIITIYHIIITSLTINISIMYETISSQLNTVVHMYIYFSLNTNDKRYLTSITNIFLFYFNYITDKIYISNHHFNIDNNKHYRISIIVILHYLAIDTTVKLIIYHQFNVTSPSVFVTKQYSTVT